MAKDATQEVTEKAEVQMVDLTDLAADIKRQEEEEAAILAKAEEIRKARQERKTELQKAYEPHIAEHREDIERIQKNLGTLAATHKQQLDELRATQQTERKALDEQMEAILVALEGKGVPRDAVVAKKGGGATGKRGPGLKASALGVVGSAEDPVVVMAPRRRAGDGVPETHNYYCDGEEFFGQMSDGTWSHSQRLSEVSSSHGWHDTKDVAAALAFAAGKPYGIMAHPGAVFANGTEVPSATTSEAAEVESV